MNRRSFLSTLCAVGAAPLLVPPPTPSLDASVFAEAGRRLNALDPFVKGAVWPFSKGDIFTIGDDPQRLIVTEVYDGVPTVANVEDFL
jgi:hypothetical protein